MWQSLFQFTKPTTITAAIDAYFRNFNLAPLTRRQYRTGLRRFEEHLLNEETINPTREKVNAITLLEVRKIEALRAVHRACLHLCLIRLSG